MRKEIDHKFEKYFFSELASRMDRDAFSAEILGGLAGFSPPNNFPLDQFKSPLNLRTFPQSDFYEYCWAIVESFDQWTLQQDYDPYFLLYVTALFIYCSLQEKFGMEFTALYIEQCITKFWKMSDATGLALMDEFIDTIDKSNDFCVEYFCLLGKLFIARILKTEIDYQSIQARLLLLQESHLLEAFDDVSYDEEHQAGWIELNKNIPHNEWSKPIDFNKLLFLHS